MSIAATVIAATAIAAITLLAALHVVDGQAALALISAFAGGAGVHAARSS